ncbi:maleylpyruvate isomerase family mycothiol-dependent enzyme [Nocardioides zeicaulis]|uniref:Maleylpyruvate isomerase family mycothiol-dependent enzyme n=1 Tax=Nocardioides zeicaulis TaxID=1776857 RepID=A0ABV6E4K2_9ACTN
MTGAHDWVDLLRTHTRRFTELLADADPDAPVEHCPGWTVRDLAVHLGGVHQWVVHAVVAGDPSLTPEPPRENDDVAGWYARQARALVGLLAATPPDAFAWTLDRDDRTAGFWRRRQVHEVVVHTWDLEHATGTTSSIDPALAWDGVREVTDVLLPRQVRLGRARPPRRTLHLVATDVANGGPVVLEDRARPATEAADPELDAPVEVRGRAEDVLLLLWHRTDPDTLGVDPRAVEVLAQALVP